MRIPSSVDRLLARGAVRDVFEAFEHDDLAKAETIVIISTSDKDENINVHYGNLSIREVIGLLEQAKNTLLGGEE